MLEVIARPLFVVGTVIYLGGAFVFWDFSWMPGATPGQRVAVLYFGGVIGAAAAALVEWRMKERRR
jgi:hypothetical protein